MTITVATTLIVVMSHVDGLVALRLNQVLIQLRFDYLTNTCSILTSAFRLQHLSVKRAARHDILVGLQVLGRVNLHLSHLMDLSDATTLSMLMMSRVVTWLLHLIAAVYVAFGRRKTVVIHVNA